LTAANVPVDGEERDQIIHDLSSTIFVEAGAGTGKTTVLVERVVALVAETGLRMDRLAAITFAEPAAAELRDRIRQALEARAAHPGASAEARERCRLAALEIDRAAIQTIHSFAGAILRAFPLEAGLPPGFATMSAIEQNALFEERFRAWFFDRVTDAEFPARQQTVDRALKLGLRVEDLRVLASLLEQHYDLLALRPGWDAAPGPDLREVAHIWASRLQGLASAIAYVKDADSDRLIGEIYRVIPIAQELAAARDEDAALAALQRFAEGPSPGNLGAQKNWLDRDALHAARTTLGDARRDVGDALASHSTRVFCDLIALLREMVLSSAAERRARGVATFQDLLVWARDLLRDRPDVRVRAQSRFDRILVDEFQDTDPLQAEIALFLAGDPDQANERDWHKLRLMPGKLFVVGDPKQSIYRFRRADIAMYEAICSTFQPEAMRLGLRQNFRSRASILRWVNDHFGAAMAAVAGVQPPYSALVPDVQTAEGAPAPAVAAMGGQVEANAAAVRRVEAEAVARLVRQIVADGWLVRGEDGGLRPARAGDVCVLLPTRTNLTILERELDRYGVAYRMESGALVLDTQEVRDLLACLRAIDDPSDQVALVAALRSPAYGCSDVDLLDWVESGGRFDYHASGTGLNGRVGSAFASLREFHRARLERSAAATVEAFIRDRMLAMAALAQPRPREAWRRLRYVVAQARALTASGAGGLRSLVDWLEELQRGRQYDLESPLPESDEDAVRIMTIHGAKGREFPVVILTGLGSWRRNNRGLMVAPHRETGRFDVRLKKGFQTPGFDEVREIQATHAEDLRLLYVAATRARDHLVLSLFRGPGESRASAIASALQAAPEEYCRFIDPAASPADGEPDERAPAFPSVAEHERDENAWIARRSWLIESLATFPRMTPTSLADRMTGERGGEVGDLEAPPDRLETAASAGLRGGRGATEIGRAVHQVLQTIDLATLDGLEDLASKASVAQRVPDKAAEVVALVRQVRQAPSIERVLSAGRFWREVPVTVQIDGMTLEGVIDLLHEGADGQMTILDYKTVGQADTVKLDAMRRRYRIQGAAYALGLRRATHRRTSRCVFIVVDPSAVIEYEVEELDSTADEIAAALRR